MTQEIRNIVILLAVAGFIFLFGLGRMPLTDPDETFYAQTAKEMVQSGDWITPTIFGDPQFEKPILFYWLVGISYKIFGVSEFSARLPSAVFGMAGIIGIYLIGRLIFSPVYGLFAGLIMATSVGYLTFARACITDMVLAVFILFCLLFFIYGWQKRGRVFYLLSAAMAALAVLTKGPIGLLIPGAVIAVYLATGRRWMELKRIPVFWALCLFLAISLPWYILAAKIHGGVFISEFFGFQNVTRFLVPEHRIGSSALFYIPVVLGGVFPWTFFLLFGAWWFYKNDRSGQRPLASHKLFLSAWFLIVFIFFSISRTKLVTYIFPLFPVLAVIIGRFWGKYAAAGEKKPGFNRMMSGSYILLILTSIAGAIAVFFVLKQRYDDIALPTMLICVSFILVLVLSYFFFLRERTYLSFFSIVFAAILVIVPLGMRVTPIIAARESSKPLGDILKDVAGKNDLIGGEDDNRRGIAFYSGRKDIVDIHPYDSLIDFVSRDGRVWAVMRKKHYDQLKAQKKGLYLQTVAMSGKYVLVTNKPYPVKMR